MYLGAGSSVPQVLFPEFSGHSFDFCQVSYHLAPPIPEGIVGIGVKGSLESSHPVLKEHNKKPLLDGSGRTVESQEIGKLSSSYFQR